MHAINISLPLLLLPMLLPDSKCSPRLFLQDDLLIRSEGLDSLTDDELRSASKARGMKAAFGEGGRAYMTRQMQVNWVSAGWLHVCVSVARTLVFKCCLAAWQAAACSA